MQLNFIIKTLQLASLFKIMRFRATRKWSIVGRLTKPLTTEIAKIERACKRFRSERKEALILNACVLPRLKMNEMAASYISDLVQVHYPLRSLRSASNGLTLVVRVVIWRPKPMSDEHWFINAKKNNGLYCSFNEIQ